MYIKVKRVLDIIFSILFILGLSPMLIVISVLLYIKYHKVIYKQERSGLNNKIFNMYKFYTIHNGNIDNLGKFLRKSGLDELPQLINIINGDMSFIGPRAWVTDYSKYFNDYQLNRLKVLPGITGYSQVSGRYKLNIFEKIEHDIYYVNNVNFWFDFKIFIKTFGIILDKNNSYLYDYSYEIEILKNQNYDYKPLVSIIIPNYNKEKYLDKCLKSILDQSYENYEVIIVDDASTDSSVSIIEKYINNKIKLIKLNENKGIAYARNIGLKNSKGRMICFLDSDDYWNQDKLTIQVKYMIENKIGFSFTSYYFVRDNKLIKKAKCPHTINFKKALKNTIIWTSTVMIDTTLIDKKYLLMPNIKSEDTACWYSILKRGYIAYSINKPLSYYVRSNNTESSNKLQAVKNTFNLYYKYLDYNMFKSSYYFIWYLFNTIKKRL